MADLITHFSNISDKRKLNGICHKHIDFLVIAICGVICSADDWVMIEYFGNVKREWVEIILDLPHGISSHDTFGKVFALIDAKELQKSFLNWVNEIAEIKSGQLIAISGKTACWANDRSKGKEATHLVSAWVRQDFVVLAKFKWMIRVMRLQ